MKILQKSFVVNKLDFDFVDRNRDKPAQAQMSRDKSFTFPANEGESYLIRLISTYQFVFGERINSIELITIFNAEIESGEDINNKNEKLDEILDAIVSPQEIAVIKDIFTKFGINIKDGLPLGSQFSI